VTKTAITTSSVGERNWTNTTLNGIGTCYKRDRECPRSVRHKVIVDDVLDVQLSAEVTQLYAFGDKVDVQSGVLRRGRKTYIRCMKPIL
jgi:hypothetical protein